jgi:hypothetical protein
MAAAIQSFYDTAERPVNTLERFGIELAPDAFFQVIQLSARFSNLRLRLAADLVVIGTCRVERGASVVEFLPVISVVLGLLRDALGLAL